MPYKYIDRASRLHFGCRMLPEGKVREVGLEQALVEGCV